MRLASLLLCFLITACGGANAPANNAPESQHTPFTVHARATDAGYELLVEGSVVTNAELAQRLKAHGDVKDLKNNLRGREKDGISANLVRFSAPPQVSSQAFFAVLETAAREKLFNVNAYLEIGDGKTLAVPATLPVDDGLDGPPKWVLVLHLMPEKDGAFRTVVAIDARGRKPVEGGDSTREKLFANGWQQAECDRLKKAMKAALKDYHTKTGASIANLEVGLPGARHDLYPDWAATFTVLQAAREYATEDGAGMRVTYTFHDALGTYKND